MHPTISGAIVSAKDVSTVDQNVDVKVTSKNLIRYPYHESTTTRSNVTFTVDTDGTITANGTSNAVASITLMYNGINSIFVPKGTSVVLSGCSAISSIADIVITGKLADGTVVYRSCDSGVGTVITYAQDLTITDITVRVKSGQTVENLVFKPQIEKGSTATTYAPYKTDFTGIEVKQTGKNLLRFPYQEGSKTTNTHTITVNDDGTLLISGSSSSAVSFFMASGDYYKPPLKAGVTYVFSGIDKSTQGNIIMTVQDTKTNTTRWFSLGQPNGFLWEEHYQFTNVYLSLNAGAVFDNTVIKLQLEIGTVPTEYEPPTRRKDIVTATANADGTVNGFPLRSPNVTFYTDNDDVTINYQYYRDIDTCIDNLIAGVVLSGGE